MSVTREQIRRIAELAELQVDDAQAAELEVQLNRILGYVEQLGELPKDEMVKDERVSRLRRDVPSSDTLHERPEAWAPAMKNGLFVVPKLGEMERGDDE